MIIGVDFDGTCVTHEYPKIGKDIGAVGVLKWLVEQGHKIVLFTMRGNRSADLGEAICWFADNGIPLYGINTNPTQKNWTNSPKAYCQLYIDDAALGCPLKFDATLSDRPFVDWAQVEVMLCGILSGQALVGHTKLIQGD